MRLAIGVVGLLSLASSVLAADANESTFKGWGGEGGQVFRNKVSICKNHQYNDRATLVIVDDLPRRGARIGLQRFTVEYTGGAGSDRIVSAIHKKPYEYVLVKMYETPQSPRMARVVLPQPRGVKATFRFYKNRFRNKETGLIESGIVNELTRTFETEQLEALTVVNPMRELTMRKPRGEAARAPSEVAAVPAPAPAPDAPMSDAAPLDQADPRLAMARKVSADIARGDEPVKAAPEIGLADIPYDAPGYAPAPPRERFEYEEDTPEMKAAEARANAPAEKIKVQQAFE